MADREPSAGDLRQRLQWQRNARARDKLNQLVDDWRTIATVWADVRPLGGSRLFAARQLGLRSTHRVILRGGRDVRPGDRFLYGNTARALYPDSINRVGELNAWIDIDATEKTTP